MPGVYGLIERGLADQQGPVDADIDFDNQQTTVTHFGENKRLDLESSKQNYYIISF